MGRRRCGVRLETIRIKSGEDVGSGTEHWGHGEARGKVGGENGKPFGAWRKDEGEVRRILMFYILLFNQRILQITNN